MPVDLSANPAGDDRPKVSCLMVTANRRELAERAVHCYLQQTWTHKEFIVVDDGEQDYEPLLRQVPSSELRYVKLDGGGQLLGALRNRALDEATGDFVVQWDDDDWYHPERIERQAGCLMQGYDACCLSASLMHINTPEFFYLPYVGTLPEGIPGSLMHRNDPSIRYPELARGEDTVYMKQWMKRRYGRLPASEARLFIRCYHGSNTWEKHHFLRRIRNTTKDALWYLYYHHLRGRLSEHPRFQLPEKAREAFHLYLSQSRRLGIFNGQTSAYEDRLRTDVSGVS